MSDDYDELCIPSENAQECTEKEDTGPNLFDIINSISNQQKSFYDEVDGMGIPKSYSQYMINKANENAAIAEELAITTAQISKRASNSADITTTVNKSITALAEKSIHGR